MPLDLVTRPQVLDGEILPPGEGGISVLGAAHPFRTEQTSLEVPPGLTVQEILDLALMQAGVKPCLAGHVHVMLERDGRQWEVDRRYFRQVRPKPGTNLLFRVAPKGGGGGGKNPLRTMLMLAVTVAALVAAPYIAGPAVMGFATGSTGFAIASGIVGAGITLVGTMLVNAIAPPRLPELSTSSNAAESPTYRLAGARNVANHFGPVPSILGRHRVHPNYGAMPYTEMVGQDNYLRMMFIFGYGPLALEDIRIGETPITDFADWEMELRGVEWVGDGPPPGTLLDDDDPFTLYPGQVIETQVGVVLADQNVWVTRTSEADVDELSVDVDFPQGLVRFSGNDGGRRDRSVEIEVEYRPVGGGSWTQVLSHEYRERSAQPLRFGHRWKVSRGQYEVRVRRTTEVSSSDRIFDTVTWSVLRSIRDEDPLDFERPLAAMALRIKATEQLSGVIDSLNAICTTIALDYRNGSWSARPTTNPASLYRHVLQGPANARPRTNDQIDLPALEAWHQFCEVEGFAFNHVRDFDASVWSTLADIASAGRAAPAILDGRWGVVMDGAGKPIVQHITPRNSWGFSAERVYRHLPHGWRIRFISDQNGWNHDERIVYDDGYDETNATLFEGLELPGVTDPDLVWRHGRYHIASARLRPEVFSWNMDFEHIVFRRGDLVRVTHDVTMWGLGSARVKEVLRDGSLTTGIVLDDELPAEAGKEYAVRVRRQDGASWVRSVTNPGGTSYTLDFKTPVAQAQGPQVGDLVLFGEEGQESVELLIRSIEPGGDLTARVTGIDYAPQLYLADTGPIPPYDPQITRPPDLTEQAPEVPRIIGIVTGSAALQNGREEGRIIVRVAPFSGTIPVRWIETRHRLRGSEDSWTITREDAESQTVVIRGVEVSDDTEKVHYDIAARSVSPWGVRSAWSDEVGTESAADDIPPGPVTGLRTQGGLRQIVVSWENPPDPDLDHVEVWAATSNDRALATRAGVVRGSSFVHSGLGGLDTRWYWARAVDVGGNIGPWNAEQGTPGTSEQVSHDDLVERIIDQSLLIEDLQTPIGKIPLLEEALSSIERFGARNRERVNQTFEQVDQEFQRVGGVLEQVDQAFEIVNDAIERIDDTFERVDGDVAQVVQDITTLQTDLTAEAERIDIVEAQIGSESDDPSQSTLWARVARADQAIVDEEQARASAISAVQSQVDDNRADIITTQDAIADETSARVTAINTLSAQVDDNAAAIVSTQDALADETSARVSAINALVVDVGDNAAAITAAQQAIADEESARVTADNALGARVDDNEADILSVQSAIADETSARTTAINSLSARVDDNEADIVSVQQAVADETSARTSAVNALSARVDDAEGDIATTQQAIADETSARTQAITTLTSRVDDNEAAITNAQQAIADEESARVTAVSQLQTQVGDNAASITNLDTAISDETSARTQAISALQSDVDGNLALIQANQQAIADEASARASAVSQLQASIGDNAAAISSVEQAIADETSARTSAISTLQAEVDDNVAAIQTNASAIADVDGLLQAQYTLKVQAGDVIAGFGLAADSGAGSEMVFLADRFAFVQPGQDNTPRYPFVIGTVNGQSRISLASTFIQDLSLPGIKLADGAITARKLAISPSENIAVEPYFEEGGANWTHTSEVTIEPHVGSRSPGGHRARIGASSSSNQSLYSSRIRVEPGETYLFRALVARVGTATTGNLRLTVRNLLADGTMQNYGTTNSGETDPSEGGYKTLEATVTIDEDIYFVQPSLQVINSDGTGSGWHVYSIFFARRVGTTLIDDNGITTPKVRADTIITDHLIGAAVNDTYSTSISSDTYLSTTDNDKRTGLHTIGSYTTTSEGQGRIYFWLSNGYSADGVVAYARKNATLTATARIWLRAKYGSSTVTLSSDTHSPTGDSAVRAQAEIHGTYGYLAPGKNTTVTFELESETDGGNGEHTHHQNSVRLMILECKR